MIRSISLQLGQDWLDAVRLEKAVGEAVGNAIPPVSRPNLEASLNHGGFFSVRNGPEGITQCCRHGSEDVPIFLPLK